MIHTHIFIYTSVQDRILDCAVNFNFITHICHFISTIHGFIYLFRIQYSLKFKFVFNFIIRMHCQVEFIFGCIYNMFSSHNNFSALSFILAQSMSVSSAYQWNSFLFCNIGKTLIQEFLFR